MLILGLSSMTRAIGIVLFVLLLPALAGLSLLIGKFIQKRNKNDSFDVDNNVKKKKTKQGKQEKSKPNASTQVKVKTSSDFPPAARHLDTDESGFPSSNQAENTSSTPTPFSPKSVPAQPTVPRNPELPKSPFAPRVDGANNDWK